MIKKQKLPALLDRNMSKGNLFDRLSEKWQKIVQRSHPMKPERVAKSRMIYLPENENRLHDLHQRIVNFLDDKFEDAILEHIESCADEINNLVVIYEINNFVENSSDVIFSTDHKPALVPCFVTIRNR